MEMKYNKSYGENSRGFQEYIEYLNTIKKSIPAKLYKFISDPERHNSSDKSLHDSTVEKIEFINDFNKSQNIVLTLSGVMRKFIISFIGISNYKIIQNLGNIDLLTYEIGLEEHKYDPEGDYDSDTYLVFRAEFCDGEIEIFCKKIKIEEILV